jgi:hypothetical protein
LLSDDSGLPLGDFGFRFSIFTLFFDIGETLIISDRSSRRFCGGEFEEDEEELDRRPR